MTFSTEELKLNAQLQQKKNRLRKALKEKGVLKKEGANSFDKYKYFSEAQYKELFTGLFSDYGLELKATTINYEMFDGSDKMPNGRKVTVRFSLIDTETGYLEESDIVGEGLDKGDKAGYKAYTGALKYYLAENFAVATGDDPEKESPEAKTKERIPKEILDKFQTKFDAEYRRNVRNYYHVERDEDIPPNIVKGYVARKEEEEGIKAPEKDLY